MISVDVTGLEGFEQYFEALPGRARKAASLALNQTAERTVVPKSRDLIQEQINFPNGYLNKERLFVDEKASLNHLEVSIKGRDRPTSLLRFATVGAKDQVTSVTVQPGRTLPIKRGFVIRLKNGNLGFAMRLRPGETIRHRHTTSVQIAPGLVLLYGPSVNQAFASVATQLTPVFLESLSAEFLRQFTRDNL